MREKILGILIFLTVFVFAPPIAHVTAENDAENYIMVDMETGAEKTIDLDKSQYDVMKQFVSKPSLPDKAASIDPGKTNSGIDTHSIIGSDDRWKITNTGQYPYSTIAKITVTYQNGVTCYGTGAMISPRLLATVGHVLFDNGSHPKSIKMEFGLNGNYVYYKTSDFSSYIYREGYETDHPIEADYGFIVFKNNKVSQATGYMGIVTSPQLNERLYTAGYPAAKGENYMYAATGSIVKMEDDLIYHNMDTQPGQSGSPVYVKGSDNGLPYLAAMHSSGATTYNIARRLEPQLFYWLEEHGYLK